MNLSPVVRVTLWSIILISAAVASYPVMGAEKSLVISHLACSQGQLQFDATALSHHACVIQAADNQAGPWSDLQETSATPISIPTTRQAARYFRLQAKDQISINLVGIVNLVIPPGLSLIANPLDRKPNTVGILFTDIPEGTTLYKFDSVAGRFTINSFEIGEWSNPDQKLEVGEGAFILNPGTTSFTNVFFGEVFRGALPEAQAGLSIRSCALAMPGDPRDVCGFPFVDGDVLYRFRHTDQGQFYAIHRYELGDWNEIPFIDVGEAFFVRLVSARNICTICVPPN